MRTIMFIFGGRKPNIELTLPYYQRILDQHPNVEVHLWDLARNPADSTYMRSLPTTDRFKVRTEFYGPPASRGQVRVWRHYMHYKYRDCLFVKLDDDLVFIETAAFGEFLAAAAENPEHVISALTINNGASTPLIPDLAGIPDDLSIPLLDVHLSGRYAKRCHEWFHQNWTEIIGRDTDPVPTQDWLSINCIAYNHTMARRIGALLGTRPPHEIAGRYFTPRNKIGDEGAVNMQPRMIHPGLVAAHLNFGPQCEKLSATTWDEIRAKYAELGRRYLSR